MNNVLLDDQVYLNDRDFLHELDLVHNKVIYAKIISLTFEEDPIEEIQGRVTQGNVSIDGKSALRRTCSISLVANELNIHEYYWGLNTKFQFYIGVQNDIEPKYPDIIWFKMGTYLITSFSTSQQVNSYTISLQGKDKMCLLNGEIGGVITPLSWDFGTIENIQDDGSKVIEKYLIKNIITEAVHEHAREPFWNIIVNDLDDLALELLEYRGDKTMYLLFNIDKDMIVQFFIPEDDNEQFDSSLKALKLNSDGEWELDPSVTTYADVKGDPRVTAFKDFEQTYTRFWVKDIDNSYIQVTNDDGSVKNNEFSLLKVEYGETIGYRLTDLVYPGDLISNVGESVTSMLDKLVNMLGNYEYFYNLDGQFVFQRKPVYYEVSWNNIIKKRNVNYLSVEANEGYSDLKSYAYLDGKIMHDYYTYEEESWNKWTSQGLMYEVVEADNYVDNTAGHDRWTYSFTDDMLVTSFANQPNLLNLRNDYSIWGVRKGISGADIPIHLRYAIDVKPKYYKSFDGIEYISEEGKQEILDWYDLQIRQAEERKHKKQQYIPTGDNIFRKQAVPAYLQNSDGSSDWWDLLNWAEYYKLLTGEYPARQLMDYKKRAFQGDIIFPIAGLQHFSNQLIFDTYRSTHEPYTGAAGYHEARGTPRDGAWIYSPSWSWRMHGASGCYHTYPEFMELNQNYDFQSFIFDPVIPPGVVTIVDENYYEIIDDGTLDAEILALQEAKEEFDNNTNAFDWRELIYQMAIDYRKHNHDEDFHVRIVENNKKDSDLSYYPKGYTGYEPYYIDLEGFWRTLYNPDYTGSYQVAFVTEQSFSRGEYYYYKQNEDTSIFDANKQYFYKNYLGQFVEVTRKVRAAHTQATDGQGENYIFDSDGNFNNPTFYWYIVKATSYDDTIEFYYKKIDDEFDSTTFWSKQITENPAGLNFWFDFLENNSELDRYSVKYIGDRPKAENDNDVKAIYFRDIPDVIFTDASMTDERIRQEEEQRPGYEFVRLPEYLDDLFSVSRQGKSAIDKLDTFLYNYACCTESITMNTIPVYYLEPNTRIFVHDENSGIEGEYLIDRLSIPLSNNGTMSISATKALERLY